MFSSGSLILVASANLESEILTCDTSHVALNDRSCTVFRIPGQIWVSRTSLSNASTRISAITANKSFSSSLCDHFGKRTEWGSQSCWYVWIILWKSSNCCCFGDEVYTQTIVPDIYRGIVTSSCGQVMAIGLWMQRLSCTLMQRWRIWFGFTKVWYNFYPIHSVSLNKIMNALPEFGQVHNFSPVTTGTCCIDSYSSL